MWEKLVRTHERATRWRVLSRIPVGELRRSPSAAAPPLPAAAEPRADRRMLGAGHPAAQPAVITFPKLALPQPP